jgi:N-acyl-D-aspartate/D-glutamate deacylase
MLNQGNCSVSYSIPTEIIEPETYELDPEFVNLKKRSSFDIDVSNKRFKSFVEYVEYVPRKVNIEGLSPGWTAWVSCVLI